GLGRRAGLAQSGRLRFDPRLYWRDEGPASPVSPVGPWRLLSDPAGFYGSNVVFFLVDRFGIAPPSDRSHHVINGEHGDCPECDATKLHTADINDRNGEGNDQPDAGDHHTGD